MAKKTKKLIERDQQIYEITSLAAGDFELQDVLGRLARAAVEITKTKACSIRLLDDEAGDLKMTATFGLSERYRKRGVVLKHDKVIKAAFEGQAVVLDDMRTDERVKHPQAAREEGLVSQLTVAMIFKNKPIGVLRLYSPRVKRFDENDITLARLVASQCAVAITNARLYAQAIDGARMAEQMRLGGVIQRRMIPQQMPCLCGLDVAAVYQPCFQIGGDMYDFIRTGERSVAVAIADVIGKGIPAAIMMSMFRGTIRAYADGGFGRHSMADIVKRLNKTACRECRDGEFITSLFVNIDVGVMRITYSNCGHEPGLLVRDNQIIELDKGGLVLGVMEDAKYDIETVALKEGDTLLLYTDGLIDAVNFDGDIWGKENLLRAIKDCVGCSADCLIRKILGYRRRFVGLAMQTDDTSMVAIKLDKDANKNKGN